MTALWIVLCVIALFLIFLFIFSGVVIHMAVGVRFDENPAFTYFRAEDFCIEKEEVKFRRKKDTLKGYIYNLGGQKGAIVFCHGMGPGCSPYMTEVAKLCSLGYRVLAVDYKGCGLSEGKKAGSFYAGVKAIKMCLEYACKRWGSATLVGHSWGAYTALVCSNMQGVDKVVAISAPDSAPSIYTYRAKLVAGKWAQIIYPFIYVLNLFKGAKENEKASKAAKKAKCPILCLQGDADKTVDINHSAYNNLSGQNIQKMLYRGKAHSPQLTLEAEKLLKELSYHARLKTDESEYFKNADFKGMCAQDEDVWSGIQKFLQT